jgi:hypothetical protein
MEVPMGSQRPLVERYDELVGERNALRAERDALRDESTALRAALERIVASGAYPEAAIAQDALSDQERTKDG